MRLPIRLVQGSTAHRLLRVAGGALAVLLVLSVFTVDTALRIGQLNDVVAYAVAILGLVLAVGCSGQLSLGQSVFLGLGAYTTVILVADHGWSYYATIPVSTVGCFVVGLLIGLPASRLRGAYLAIVTLAMAYVFPALIVRFDWLTGGTNGKGPPRGTARLEPPSWFPFADRGRLAQPLWTFTLLVALAGVASLLVHHLVRSRPGRAILAVRDNEASATASGIDVAMYKAVAFALSAACGGLAGTMLMMNRPFASEVQFTTRVSIFLLVAAVVGGLSSIWGAIPGAFVYLFVPYWITDLSIEWGATVPPGLVFGVILLVLVFLMPGGLAAAARAAAARLVVVVANPPWLRQLAQRRRAADAARSSTR